MLDNLKYFSDVSMNDLHKLHFVPLLILISVPSQDSRTYLARHLKGEYHKTCLWISNHNCWIWTPPWPNVHWRISRISVSGILKYLIMYPVSRLALERCLLIYIILISRALQICSNDFSNNGVYQFKELLLRNFLLLRNSTEANVSASIKNFCSAASVKTYPGKEVYLKTYFTNVSASLKNFCSAAPVKPIRVKRSILKLASQSGCQFKELLFSCFNGTYPGIVVYLKTCFINVSASLKNFCSAASVKPVRVKRSILRLASQTCLPV